MKKILLFVSLACIMAPFKSFAQLPDGAIAPDWTMTDINGNTHHLYSLLDQGKMVVIEFSATWCGPCWNYMLTGALEDFWNEHGPNGTNMAQVFYIEADESTGMDDLLGLTPSSQGNWIANIPFPIIDLQPGQSADEDYQINYYPTLYAVCSDHKIYELGQVGSYQWEEFMTSCQLAAEVANVEEAVCFGDGSISLNVTGGIPPFDYDWSNGAHTPSLQNLGAGTYSVTVTEDNGKDVVIEDIVVTGAETPVLLASSEVEPALCFQTATGSVSVEVDGGTGPYSYDWSNGAQTQNLTNVMADTYSVTATDDNGCTVEESFDVSEPDELLAEYETTPEYCEQEDGSVTLDINGGVGNYDLTASAGNVFGYQILDLTAGTVIATVEDGNGCIWQASIEIEGEEAPLLSFSPNPTITCIEPLESVTGFVIGGSGDYQYQWSTTNGHIVGASNQNTVVVDQAGNYTLGITDLITGCFTEEVTEVESTVDPPSVSAGNDTPITCEDLQPELQGVGDPANAISWTTSNGIIVSGANTYTPTISAPGTYVLQVTNPANACTNHDTVVIANGFNPAVAEYQYQTSGLTMIGTDNSTGSNVTGWTWTFGDGNTSNDQNTVHTYAATGIYEVCLSVQNGCGTSNSCHQVEVTSSGSSIAVQENIQNVLCNAGNTGSILIVVNGGSGNYTYTWTGPDGQTYTDPLIDSLVAGVYQLVVSDDQGNLFIGEYTVTEPSALTLLGSTVVDNLCFGEANGSVAVDINGGVGPFQYSFNNGPFQTENSISQLSAGMVECLVVDANGCPFAAGPYTIQQPAVISHEASITSVRCFGESNGAVALSVSGGVGPYSYLWDNGGSTTSELSQLAAGVYSCAITDHNGCLNQAAVEVTQPGLLVATNIVVTDASNTEQNNGSVSIEVNGGVAPYQVSWSNGGTGTTLSGLAPGEYWYTITDANGCVTASTLPVVISGTVSTSAADWSQYIAIAPNPSKGDVIISWKGLQAGNGIMTLVTKEGKRLQSTRIMEETGTWDLSGAGLSSGIYIVLLEMRGEAVPFKLVIL